MPVTEVQWIGASCGRHSSYTFYRGFRLIADGVVKNFCLGEFYFVRNSTNDPICIAELQLVWHDASSDSQLASARLYFRPEDTPVGRLPNHGQDELLYADQKVVIKCHDMAVWEDSGLQWDSGMVPLYERDFVCIDDRYYLNSHYDSREKERFQTTSEAWKNRDQPRNLRILTFPAYCRYRALKKRLLSGACLSKAQLVALGGILGDQRSTRVLFCRDSFHHPYLDKFELSGDNKAPVLKGRPRKKKKLNAPQNSVLQKKRFVADIQNHLGSSPAAKRCKISEEDESASSDMSEGVMEQIKLPPQAPRAAQNSGPPQQMKPKVQILPKGATQNVPLTSPPPLISSNSFKGDVQRSAQLSHEQVNAKVMECSRTTPMQKQVHAVDSKLKKLDKVNNNNKDIDLLDKSQPVDNIQTRVTFDPLTSLSSSLCRTGKTLTTSAQNKQLLQPQAAKVVTNPLSMERARAVTAGQAEMCSLAANTRPVATTQGTVGTQVAVSTGPIVRTQPVASLPQPVASAQAVAPKLQQFVTTVAGSALPAVKPSDVGNIGATLSVRSKPSKENEDKQSRLTGCVSEERKENEMDHGAEEPVVWKKKKKRLRMPGSVKDEVYDDEDEKYFMQTLGDFMRKNNQPLGKLPALGFKKVNLWTMYTTAQKFGGYDAVTSKRLWRRVYDSLGGSTTITSAATYTRRHYERLLLPYERHIRSQLKKQMDEKNPSSVNELTPKDPFNKPEKKQGLTESNNKQTSSTSPDKDKAPAVKHDLASTGANPVKAPQKGTVLSTLQTMPVKVNATSRAQGNALKTAPSGHTMQTAALSTVSEDFVKHDLPPAPARPFKQEHHESKAWSNRTKAEVSQPSAVPTERREVISSEHFQAPSTYQHTSYRCIKVMSSDEETSARTNTIYTKNTTEVNSNPKPSVRAASPHRVTRVVHDVAPKSSSPQQLTAGSKGREVIDLTSDDSPPRPQSKNPSVPRVQISQGNGNTQGTAKVPQTVSSKDSGVRMRHAPKTQFRKEYEGGSRHPSIGEVQPSKEASPVYDSQTYSVLQQVKPKVPSHLPANSPTVAVKKNPEEVYSVKQETGLPKHDKKRHQQARVEGIDGRFAHSLSTDSVNEHFAELFRRPSGVSPRSKPPVVCHQRHISNPDMGKLTYSYVPEDMCPPDCPCSLPTSRHDESVSVAPPKPKEHYEEDPSFASMTWGPAMMDHPELYIPSSHGPHLPPPPDSLATHMYTASRIFIPPAQIFSSPYHMGMPPMGAPPLIAGTDDQLHIHPHCLMASPYPCSSSSRTPDGAAYPLYSFT